MAFFDDLLPATFRGVPFLVNSDETARGKKLAVHEFINSDRRFDEELGLIPPKYTMTGWVKTLAARERLERALLATGLGTLTHPVYGSVPVMALPYSVSWSQKQGGLHIFSLAFDSSQERVTMRATAATAADVESKSEQARTSTSVTLEKRNTPPDDVPGGGSVGADSPEGLPQTAEEIEAATEQMETTLEAIAGGLQLARNVVQREAAVFTSTINGLLRDVGTIVRSAEGMREALEAAYVALANLVNTPADLYDSYLSLTDTTFAQAFPSTVSRQRRAIFAFVLAEHTRLAGLTGLAAAMTAKEYLTQSGVLADVALWQSLYETLVRRPDDSLQAQVASYLRPNAASVTRDPTTQDTLQALSASFSEAMAEKQQNAWRVATRKVSRGSLYLLTYQLYDSLDNLELIRGLNPAGLDGDVNVGEQ